MRSLRTRGLLLFSCITLLMLFSAEGFSYQKAQMMTTDELKAIIDDPDVAVIDVRTGIDWKSSEWKIK